MTLWQGEPGHPPGAETPKFPFVYELLDRLGTKYKPATDLALWGNDSGSYRCKHKLILGFFKPQPVCRFAEPCCDPRFPPRCDDCRMVPRLGVEIAAGYQQQAFQNQPGFASGLRGSRPTVHTDLAMHLDVGEQPFRQWRQTRAARTASRCITGDPRHGRGKRGVEEGFLTEDQRRTKDRCRPADRSENFVDAEYFRIRHPAAAQLAAGDRLHQGRQAGVASGEDDTPVFDKG